MLFGASNGDTFMPRCAGLAGLVPMVLALFSLTCGQPARAAEGGGGTVLRGLTMQSPHLGRPIAYSAYVPDAPPPWATLILLHPYDGADDTWRDHMHVADVLRRMRAEGTARPMLLVMPAAGNSWYVDDPRLGGFGPVRTAFLEDLPAGISARFPQAARCRAGRAVAGSSMGGYGALLMALDRPDLFAAAAVFSPSIFRESSARTPDSPNLPLRAFGSLFGQPLDWQRFDAWTLVPRVARLPAPGAGARPAFWIMAGSEDFEVVLDGSVRLHMALRRARVETALRIIPGNHGDDTWKAALPEALTWLSTHLDPAACSGP
jgi:enterochelin esterase family protein